MYNKFVAMGRIASDITLRTVSTGKNIVTFRIAVDRKYQKSGEEKKTDFFNCVAWGNNAEFINRYFSKGRMILVEGEMNTRPYKDKNGNDNTWYEISVERATFTGEPKETGEYERAAEQRQAPAPTYDPMGAGQDFSAEATDDDYPF